MKTTFKKPLIIALALVLLLTGCSKATTSSKKNSSRDSSTKSEEYTTEYRETAAAAPENGYSYGIVAEDAYEYEYNYDYEYQELSNDITNNNSLPSGAMLIRTMTITADTADFPTLESIVDNAVKTNGGYYESMNITGTGNERDYRSARYVIRVPSDKLDSLVSSLEGHVTVTNRSESTEDVTLDYVDMESRLESLRIELDDLMGMLEEAKDMETIVYLQGEISSVRYQIESYESQARYLENQVTYSTLYLNLNEVIEEKEKETIEEKRQNPKQEKTLKDEMSETWSETVANVKENAKEFLLWTISALPVIILFCIIILTIIIILVVRKHKKNSKKAAKQTTPESKKE